MNGLNFLPKMIQSKALNLFLNDSAYEPEKMLGPNWETIFNFWIFIENLEKEQWESIASGYYNVSDGFYNDFIEETSERVCSRSFDAQFSTWIVANDKKVNGNARLLAIFVTYELIAMHEILNSGRSIIYLPLFENL